MKFSTFTAILALVFAILKTSGSFAQCAPALQLEKITPTTNFFDFNGAAPDGNVAITSITPSTGSNGGLGWTGSGTGSVFATSASLAFNAEVVTQTMSRPVADANLDGNGAVVTIQIRPSDGINGVGTTAGSEASDFRIIYGGVTYATFRTVLGPTTNATITTAAGATSSAATIPANGAFIFVTFTLPATIPNTGTFSLQFQSNSPSSNGGDDYSVRSVSFKSCPTSIFGNVFNDIDGPTGGVNGAAIGGPGSATGQLHAILVGPAGTVFASVPVAANGSYSFTDNIYTSDNFSVRLSTTAGTVGAVPPAPGLPPTWFAVSETDNSPDLLQTVTVADANNNNLVGFNFGISQLPPVATDDSDTGNTPGADAVVNLLANDDLSDGSQATPANTSVTLIAPAAGTLNPDGTVTVPGQGVWSYNPATGDLSFNPDAGFPGDPTPISYTLTETATGLTDNANVTVDYTQAPPFATDDSDTGNTPGSDAVVNILGNDDLSDGSPATPANTSVALIAPAAGTLNPDGTVTVPGQGVWTYDPATGDLIFNPDAGFTGDPTPISYTLTETATGLTDNANVTVDYTQAPPVATDDSDTGNTPGGDAVVNLLANDDLSDGSPATPANTSVALVAPAGGTLNPDGTVTVPGQGVWSYDPATGDLTFNPDAGFTGDPTPISYTLTETATGLTDNANVTVDYAQVILADYGDLPYSGATVNYPKVKAAFTDADNNNVPDDAGAVWLGTVIDAEADGFTNPVDPADYGKGDDKSGAADEDGLQVNGVMAPGTVTWTITANSNQPSTVHYGLWLDWGTSTTEPDGTFDNFYSGTITTASPASQTVSVTVPASFQNGSLVNARLIVSSSALDQATGFSTDLTNGEVEDYQYTYQQALPVRLVNFEAKVSETDVELGWKATDQENFDRYEVERSLDGKNFGKIGEVASNNQAAGTYAYRDRAAAGYRSQLYYRLKMVDRAADRTDGSFSYSVMRSVHFGDLSAGSIYPNPVTDKLYIRVSDWKLVKSVTIYNVAGLQVYSSGPVASGIVDASGLGNGIHMLQIRYANGTVQTQKFARIK